MVRKVALAVDESDASGQAVEWAMRSLVRVEDELHLVYVVPDTPVFSTMPALTVAMENSHQWEANQQLCGRMADEILSSLAQKVAQWKLTTESVHTHKLPAAGGASGVAGSITEFVKSQACDVLIVGCRGDMGDIKRACMTLIGLGSVSDYCLHNSVAPTIVVRIRTPHEPGASSATSPASATPAPKTVVLSTDGSAASRRALLWTLENVLRAEDQLHLVTAACPEAFLITDLPLTVGVVAAREERGRSLAAAKNIVESEVQAAVLHGVKGGSITQKVLDLAGSGSSEVGGSICSYAEDHGASMVVAGCRGLGAVSRSMMGLLGLGSVSDYLAHSAPCPLLVVKSYAQLTPKEE